MGLKLKTFITVIIPTQLKNLIRQTLFIPWWLATPTNKGSTSKTEAPTTDVHKSVADRIGQQQAGLTILQTSMVRLQQLQRREHSADIWFCKSSMSSEQSSRKQLSSISSTTAFTKRSSLLVLFHIQNQNPIGIHFLNIRILGKINHCNYLSCFLVSSYHKILHLLNMTKNFREMHTCQKENFTVICWQLAYSKLRKSISMLLPLPLENGCISL